MGYFYLECKNRMKELNDDKNFIRSIVDTMQGKYLKNNDAEIELEREIKEFKIREELD